jgi:O-antigen/teichoic acid export membrane protein
MSEVQKQDGFKKSFLKNTLTYGSFDYGMKMIDFGATIILSRLLLPSEYGFVALIKVFSDFVGVFAGIGLGHAVIRTDYHRTFHKGLFSLSFWLGIILTIIMIALAYPIAYFYDNMALFIPTIIISLSFVTSTITIIPASILSKQLRFKELGFARFIPSALQTILMIVLAYLGFSYWSLIIPPLTVNIIQYFLLESRVKLGFYVYGFKMNRLFFLKTKSLIGNITATNIINYWGTSADNLAIGKLYGETSLGLYNRAYRFLSLTTNLFYNIFGAVLYPSLKKLKSDGGNINKEYQDVMGMISLINLPVVLLFLLFSKPLVILLWGYDWVDVAQFMPYFGILIFLQTIFFTSGNVYILQGKESLLLKLSFIGTIVIVTAMVSGAFISVLHVPFFYAIGYVLLVSPINLYLGFHKGLGYRMKDLIMFWGPKLIFSFILIFMEWYQLHQLKAIVAVLMFMQVYIFERKQLYKIWEVGLNKVKYLRDKKR